MSAKPKKKKPIRKASRLLKGMILEIHFLDHVEDGEGAMEFIVWGKVDRVDKTSLRIVSWAHENPKALEVQDCDYGTEKTFTIVRSAIIDWYHLKRY